MVININVTTKNKKQKASKKHKVEILVRKHNDKEIK